jgi:putative ABC transport system permease protein
VGVAADARHRQRYSLDDVRANWPLGGLGPQRDVYFPYTQRSNPDVTVAVRLASGADHASEELTKAIASLDPDLPVADVRSLDERLAEQERAPGGIAVLMGAYAALALFLAALGVYGVVSQSVAGRIREIGVRLALGAERRDILGMVLREGAGMVAWGVAAGLVGAWWLARLMSSLLYGVSPRDPLTFAAAVPILALVALLACLPPARRAIRLDPIQTLRCD